MIEHFPSKSVRYELRVLLDNRWQIIGAFDDGRNGADRPFEQPEFDRLRRDVEIRARQLLAETGVRGVRVNIEAVRESGSVVSRQILELERSAETAQRNIAQYSGDVPVCQSYDDFLQRPALRMIGQVLRPFLDRNTMTPIELVTLRASSKSMRKSAQVLFEGLSVAARLQGEAGGVPIRTRLNELQACLDRGLELQQRADEVRDPPKIGAGGLAAFAARIAARVPPAQQRFWYLRGLAEYTGACPSYGAKLELLLRLDATGVAPEAADALDESIAGTLDQGEMIRELLGPQRDLAAAIQAMRDFALGVPTEGPKEMTVPLGAGFVTGALPKSCDAVWERLVRSLESQQKLTHAGAESDWGIIAKLRRDLPGVVPEPYRARVDANLRKRHTDAAQQLLVRK